MERKGSPKKVVVMGAGLAAAYELTQAGHNVTVLEAQMRPGGRVYTLRDPFADGLYAEAGAVAFQQVEPDYALRYIKLFALPLAPQPSVMFPNRLFHIRGKQATLTPGAETEWPLDLTPEERSLELTGMRRKYLEPIIAELAAAAATGWPQDVLRKYDALSLTEALRAQGASNAAIDVLRLSDMGTLGREYNHHSALAILIRMVTGPMFSKPPYALAGGNELLPKAFAARLGERMCYGARVMQIEHNINGVHVVYEQGGVRQAISADYLVSALPCSALQRLEVVPQFSVEKRQALETVSDHVVSRFFFQVKKRFWWDKELSGFVATDLPISLPLGCQYAPARRARYPPSLRASSARAPTC